MFYLNLIQIQKGSEIFKKKCQSLASLIVYAYYSKSGENVMFPFGNKDCMYILSLAYIFEIINFMRLEIQF